VCREGDKEKRVREREREREDGGNSQAGSLRQENNSIAHMI
jgi:hypothetical protein